MKKNEGIDWDKIKSIEAPVIPNTDVFQEQPKTFINPFSNETNITPVYR